jgi:hypothetical protein
LVAADPSPRRSDGKAGVAGADSFRALRMMPFTAITDEELHDGSGR